MSGSPKVEGPRLTAAVGPNRPATGVYTVGYRVVSTDGHPVTGSYTFTIAGVPGEGTPSPAPTETEPNAAAAPSQSAPPRGPIPRQRSSPQPLPAWPSAGRSPSGNRESTGARMQPLKQRNRQIPPTSARNLTRGNRGSVAQRRRHHGTVAVRGDQRGHRYMTDTGNRTRWLWHAGPRDSRLANRRVAPRVHHGYPQLSTGSSLLAPAYDVRPPRSLR